MPGVKEAKQLISKKKFKEAGTLLDKLLRKKENDQLWYLRGLVSLKLRSYESAIEAFEKASMIRKRALYLRMKGISRMELFELEDALDDFEAALALDPNDLLSNFYSAICFMFLDDPQSAKYLRRAYTINRKKTKDLLKNFYIMFFRKDPLVSNAIKEDLARRIGKIKTN
jgi:tetratricopeptide (TPR) repeat protein